MTAKPPIKEAFRPAYFPQSEGVWARRGLVRCQQLAQAISEGREYYRWLDAPQLLKHALGLATDERRRFSLQYIYFDAEGTEGTAHREEIERFSRALDQKIEFQARSYQALVSEIVKHCGAADADYVAYLQSRYFK